MSTEIRSVFGVLIVSWTLCACSESNTANGNSQTHWLDACSSDAECGGGLACVCDVCAARCSASEACDVPGRSTSCVTADAPSAVAVCGATAPTMLCLEPCGGDAACGQGQRCVAGACVPGDPPGAGTAGGGAGTGPGGSAGTGSGGTGAGTAGTGGTAGAGGAAGTGGTGGTAGAGGAAGTGGAGGSSAGCVSEGEACTVVGSGPDPCCAGTACSPDVCTDSVPGMCSGTCQAAISGGLAWYSTCGDPVCSSEPTPVPPGQECTTQAEGSPCSEEGASCLTGQCGGGFACAASDPKQRPGGCPISRARYKSDVRYVDDAARRAYAEELMSLPLATYRYTADAQGTSQLGFIIEDVEPSMSVDSPRDRVNLYGYTSMAVAAIQFQAQQIEELGREIELLRSYVSELRTQCR